MKCEPCNYITTKKSNYDKHIDSTKHKIKLAESQATFCNQKEPIRNQKEPERNQKEPMVQDDVKRKYICDYCDIELSTSGSLSRHRNRCLEYKKHSNIDTIRKELENTIRLELQAEYDKKISNHNVEWKKKEKEYKTKINVLISSCEDSYFFSKIFSRKWSEIWLFVRLKCELHIIN